MIERGVVQPADAWGDGAIAEVASRVERGVDRKEHAQALANLARVLVWAGKVEDARRALEVAPEILLDKKNSGWSLEAAAGHILLASVFLPENDMTHQVFGLIMAERGRYEVAYPSLREALRLNPGNVEAERALARLRGILGPDARGDSPKVTLKRYPSGAPRQIVQVRSDATGRTIPHGISVEWYEGGELERVLDYADGVPHGAEVSWDPSGRIVSRAENRHGNQMPAPATDPAKLPPARPPNESDR